MSLLAMPRPLIVAALVATMVPTVAWSHAYLYVANQGDNSVSVIDTADDQIKATITGVKSPYNATATPDGSRLIVTSDDATVTLVDTTTSAIVGALSLRGPAFGVAFSPDGKVAYLAGCTEPGIASCNGQVISVVDMSSFTVTRAIPVPPGGFWPGVAIDHDGTHLYVSNESGIFRVDITTGAVTKLSSLPGGAMSIAAGNQGRRVYVAGQELAMIDTESDSVVAEVPLDVAPIGIAISPDGSHLYMSDCDNQTSDHCTGGFLSVFDTVTRKVVKRIALGSGTYPYGVAVSPDGARVYVADDNDPGTVTVVDARRDVVLAQIKVGSTPFGVAAVSVPAAATSAPKARASFPASVAKARRAAADQMFVRSERLRGAVVENAFHLQDELQHRQYQLVEAQLDAAQARFLSDPDFESVLQDAAAFADGSSRVRPVTKAFIDAWVQARPDSAWAHYSEGLRWSHDVYSDNTRADYVEARKELRKALQLDPKLVVAWVTLIDVDRADPGSGLKDATQDYAEASAQSPRSLLVAEGYMLALKPRWSGDTRPRAEFVAAKISDTDKNPRFWGLQGDAVAAAGCLDCADGHWEAALKFYAAALAFEDRPDWLVRAGDAALHLHRFGLAHEYYARASSYEPVEAWAAATGFLAELCDPKASPARLKHDREDASLRSLPDVDYFQRPRDCTVSAAELPWGDEAVPDAGGGLQAYAIGPSKPVFQITDRRATFPYAARLDSPDSRYVLSNVPAAIQKTLQLKDTLTGKEHALFSYSGSVDVAWSPDSTRLSASGDLHGSDCLVLDADGSHAAVDVRQQFDKQLSGFEPGAGMTMFLSCTDWWDQNSVRVKVVMWDQKTNKQASMKMYHYSLLRGTIEEESNPSGH